MLGGAPADTDGDDGSPRSDDEGGSCLYCWRRGAGDKEGL